MRFLESSHLLRSSLKEMFRGVALGGSRDSVSTQALV